ncbi:MAG: M15 family metallopeptidase [Acidimicrobiia bacterium]
MGKLIATIVALLAAGTPIRTDNRPTGIAGQANGQVAASELVEVEPGCLAARAAAPSLARLFAAARADGIDLDEDDCYRPIDLQAVARTGACTGGNCACAGPPGFSNHGWGKAVDFTVDGRSITSFTEPAYLWLRANAGRFGWNLAAFALPGQPCPEPWHWEWVGDGGLLGLDTVTADVFGIIPSASGFRTYTGLEAGPAGYLVAGAASTPSGNGYWLTLNNGDVRAVGDAALYGGVAALALARPIVGMAATPSGRGYWLVASDGGVFSFGDAGFYGSTGGLRLNRPIVGMAATPSGRGYWLVASDGGVFSFGDAGFYGSTGSLKLRSGIVGMAATSSGRGYWMVANDGGVFSFGDAAFHGSAAAVALDTPVVGMARSAGGAGYRLVTAGGAVLGYGDAT